MKKIKIEKKILSENERCAIENSLFFTQQKKLCLNMISSPGSGKTTILTRTITELRDNIKIGVIEGDIQTDLDARRIQATDAPASFRSGPIPTSTPLPSPRTRRPRSSWWVRPIPSSPAHASSCCRTTTTRSTVSACTPRRGTPR